MKLLLYFKLNKIFLLIITLGYEFIAFLYLLVKHVFINTKLKLCNYELNFETFIMHIFWLSKCF